MVEKEFSIAEYEKISPTVIIEERGVKLAYSVPNRVTLWRVNTIRDKEPDTLLWLDSIGKGEVLLDIGANVGMYSIWAAKTNDVQVYAFEPESQNYALLNKNIVINQLSEKIVAFPVAISDKTKFDALHLSQFITGGSCHTFDEKVDYHLKPFTPQYSQGCFATTVDNLVEEKVIPVPEYIKIDVDGIEHKVIKGAKKTLKNKKVKSVLIEVNTHLPEHLSLLEDIEKAGFTYSKEDTDKYMRKEGAFAGVGNYIFYREGKNG